MARAQESDRDVRISGFVQVDAVAYRQSSQDELDPATGAPLNETRFVLRRAHLRADVERGLVTGAIEIDANTIKGALVRPIGAEVSLRWPARTVEMGEPFVMLTAGLFKTPFGFEVVEADTKRPFLERSTVMRALFPGEYDLGVRLQGRYRVFEAALAIMNGDPIGERAFPARDSSKSKDLVGRLGVRIPIAERVALHVGVSGVSGLGFHAGTPSTKDTLVFRDANQNGLVEPSEIQVIAGSASTPSETFSRFALGLDARLLVQLPRVGALVLRAEMVWSKNLDRGLEPADPIATGRPARERGWYVGFSQELGRHLQVGMRYDRYDPDADARRQLPTQVVPVDRAYATLAYMVAVRLPPARFVAQYDRNWNALGRDASGAPTTLKDDAFTLRAEVVF